MKNPRGHQIGYLANYLTTWLNFHGTLSSKMLKVSWPGQVLLSWPSEHGSGEVVASVARKSKVPRLAISDVQRSHDHFILVHLCVCVYIFLYRSTIYIYILSYMPHYKIYKYIYIYDYISLYVVVVYCCIEYPNLHLQKLNSVTLP